MPNSCCHDRDSNCGEGILDPRRGGSSDEARRQKIYVTGCLTILKDKLQVSFSFHYQVSCKMDLLTVVFHRRTREQNFSCVFKRKLLLI